MDTSDYPSLPNLNRLHASLAANSRRVEAVVDSQLAGIERLFTAMVAEDWPAVAEASQILAQSKPEQVGVDVIRAARHVCDELRHSPDGSAHQPKHLSSLLAACRAVRTKLQRR
ncbi:MAG: hypothetical protein ACR2NM_15185 [Bythopirellula sp.]